MPCLGDNSIQMEGVMKRLSLIIISLLSLSSVAADKMVFLNAIYGQIHQNQSRYSRVISTFECGQPFKMLEQNDALFVKVSYASYEGYILQELLSDKKPTDCWQDKYRKFFEYMDLDVTKMHYWGRLKDLTISGKVMP